MSAIHFEPAYEDDQHAYLHGALAQNVATRRHDILVAPAEVEDQALAVVGPAPGDGARVRILGCVHDLVDLRKTVVRHRDMAVCGARVSLLPIHAAFAVAHQWRSGGGGREERRTL